MAHWRASKAAKEEANWATRAALGRRKFEHDGEIPIHIVGHPKTANEVDKQNLISGLKHHFDGIALALGVNDKHFAAPTVEWAEPVPRGKVVVTVGGGE